MAGRMRVESAPLSFETLEPETKAVALRIRYFHPVTVAIQKHEQHGVGKRPVITAAPGYNKGRRSLESEPSD